LKSARQKRSNFQQPFLMLLKSKEMNPIFKALLKFYTTKTFSEKRFHLGVFDVRLKIKVTFSKY